MFVSPEANARLSRLFGGRAFAYIHTETEVVRLHWNVREEDEWWSIVALSYTANDNIHYIGLEPRENSPAYMHDVLDRAYHIVEQQIWM